MMGFAVVMSGGYHFIGSSGEGVSFNDYTDQ